jgi:hypothetical protein
MWNSKSILPNEHTVVRAICKRENSFIEDEHLAYLKNGVWINAVTGDELESYALQYFVFLWKNLIEI